MLALYDLEDNLITVFDDYFECAEYFNTTNASLHTYICKTRKGLDIKKRDIKRKRWCRLFKIEEDNEDEE